MLACQLVMNNVELKQVSVYICNFFYVIAFSELQKIEFKMSYDIFCFHLTACLAASKSKPMQRVDIPVHDWPTADFPRLKYPLHENEAENREIENRALDTVPEI